MIPAAVSAFKKLIEEKEEFEEASKEKIKRAMSPLFMCLLEEPSVYNVIIESYGELPNSAKSYIKERFESILKIVLKTPEASTRYLIEMYRRQKNTENELLAEEYRSLLELFKSYMRNQGMKSSYLGAISSGHLSDILKDIIFENKDVEFLKDSCAELTQTGLVYLLYTLHSQSLLTTEAIKTISDKVGIPVLELMLEVIFYTDQSIDVWPKLNSLKDTMIKMETIEEMSRPEFIHKIVMKLNSIMPNKALPAKQLRPVPILFMPFILSLIMRMQTELKRVKPWESFMEVIRLLISTNKHREEAVWPGLVRFAKLDKELMTTKIAQLLNTEDWEKLYNEVN